MCRPAIVSSGTHVSREMSIARLGLIVISVWFIGNVQGGEVVVADSRLERTSMQISSEKPQIVMRVPLPPAAVVTRTEDGSSAWRQLGYVPVNFTATEQSFSMRIHEAGWSSVMRVPVRSASPRTEISIWQRDDVRIMLMLWEKSVNRTGFSWGVDSGEPDDIRFLAK